MVVHHKQRGLLGRRVDDRWGVCGDHETPVQFWQLLLDDDCGTLIAGYVCVPTTELVVLDLESPPVIEEVTEEMDPVDLAVDLELIPDDLLSLDGESPPIIGDLPSSRYYSLRRA